LPPIEDAEALVFENGLGGSSGAVDVADLTPATARALTRFEQVITSAGATLTVTSAYRPAAYQQHLQAVWDKWMRELRKNVDPACGQLRVEVGEEFIHHSLLETQRPATSSDHTLGLAFDAIVVLPYLKPSRRRRFSLDRLARLCRLRRPNLRHDPVHFRLVG
jgi:D-alanyl-D-alanine dipeptidase